MKKVLILGLILGSILLSGCTANNIKNAEFTNLTPAVIKIDNNYYLMTDEIIAANEVEEQIGKVTHIQALVSYSEDQNPYKNPSKLLKIKNIDVEKSIAIQVNENLYKANINFKNQ